MDKARINIYVCDDNPVDRLRMVIAVERMLPKTAYQLEAFTYYDEVIDDLEDMLPDIAILDINLKDKKGRTGINLAVQISKAHEGCQIIFVSDRLRDALEVYEVPHKAFIYKKEFETRIDGFLRGAIDDHYRMLSNFLKVHVGKKDIYLKPESIIYISSDRRILNIVTETDRIRTYAKLNDIQSFLSTADFVRIHESFLVNANHVAAISETVLTMSNGDKANVSRAYKKNLKTISVT